MAQPDDGRGGPTTADGPVSLDAVPVADRSAPAATDDARLAGEGMLAFGVDLSGAVAGEAEPTGATLFLGRVMDPTA
jgi:hypothetical protein